MRQIEEVQSVIRKRRIAVAIVGPDSVVTAAGTFADAVWDFRNDLFHSRKREHPFNLRHKIEQLLEAFAKVARIALEDEGHAPPTTEVELVVS
ncbi:hypothetical protein [Streptomyces sp. NPDC088752]|uniref:hypothetical protein n=1 Tax=Streptomyces sp. NPDC088752 TaxID=3154963 RepID=UPI003442FC93